MNAQDFVRYAAKAADLVLVHETRTGGARGGDTAQVTLETREGFPLVQAASNPAQVWEDAAKAIAETAADHWRAELGVEHG